MMTSHEAIVALAGKVAHVNARLAPLTAPGEQFPTLHVCVSLDDRKTWLYDIFENSRYGSFFVHQRPDGRATVECLTHHHKLPRFRKTTVASTEAALAKIEAWIVKSQGETL